MSREHYNRVKYLLDVSESFVKVLQQYILLLMTSFLHN
jgi:hypothetical protein